jgi:hypothetical protein
VDSRAAATRRLRPLCGHPPHALAPSCPNQAALAAAALALAALAAAALAAVALAALVAAALVVAALAAARPLLCRARGRHPKGR